MTISKLNGRLSARALDRCLRWWNRDGSVKGIQERIAEMESSLGPDHIAIDSERRLLKRTVARRDRLKPPDGLDDFTAAIEQAKRANQWF